MHGSCSITTGRSDFTDPRSHCPPLLLPNWRRRAPGLSSSCKRRRGSGFGRRRRGRMAMPSLCFTLPQSTDRLHRLGRRRLCSPSPSRRGGSSPWPRWRGQPPQQCSGVASGAGRANHWAPLRGSPPRLPSRMSRMTGISASGRLRSPLTPAGRRSWPQCACSSTLSWPSFGSRATLAASRCITACALSTACTGRPSGLGVGHKR